MFRKTFNSGFKLQVKFQGQGSSDWQEQTVREQRTGPWLRLSTRYAAPVVPGEATVEQTSAFPSGRGSAWVIHCKMALGEHCGGQEGQPVAPTHCGSHPLRSRTYDFLRQTRVLQVRLRRVTASPWGQASRTAGDTPSEEPQSCPARGQSRATSVQRPRAVTTPVIGLVSTGPQQSQSHQGPHSCSLKFGCETYSCLFPLGQLAVCPSTFYKTSD